MKQSSQVNKKAPKNENKKAKLTVLIVILSTLVLFGGCITCMALMPDVEKLTLNDIETPTNQETVTISGNSSYHNSSVEVLVNEQEKIESVADGNGDFSVELTLTEEREYQITAKVVKDDKVLESDNKLSIVYDKTPPGELGLDSLNKKSVVFDDDNKVDVVINGSVDEKSEIKLFKNDEEIATQNVDNNEFNFKVFDLADGINSFSVVATDEAGNISEESKFIGLKIVDKTIKYKTTTKNSSSLEQGKTKVTQKGENGEQKLVYLVSYDKNGKAKGKKVLIKKTLVKKVDRVKQIGTKAPPPSVSSSSNSGSSSDSGSSYDPTVYITNTGGKYHQGGCRYLHSSKYSKTLSEAKALGKTPCSVCDPPQ